jgi:hypothetical protein
MNDLMKMMREDAIRQRDAKAAAKGMTVAEFDAYEDELNRKFREADAEREKAFRARERAAKAAAKAAAQGKGAPVKTLPSGPLRLESILVWTCEECKTLQHEPADLKLYQCKECEGYFNENNAEGDNSNKCPDCEKRGRKVGEYSCAECDQGPMQEVDAFLCPIDADSCAPLEDESAVACHLNDEHAGEFPGEWFDDEGELILEGDAPAPAAGLVTCSECGETVPAEDSTGDEGRDYCPACAAKKLFSNLMK